MIQLDDAISQFAFGRKTGTGEPCLGLYIGTDAIELTQASLTDKGIVVTQSVRVPIPPAAAAPAGQSPLHLESDLLTQEDVLKPLLQQALAQMPVKTKNVMITLSHHFGFLRYFTFPAIERRFWNTAIVLEAKKYIPLSIDSLSYDFQVRTLPPRPGTGKPQMAALVAVTPKKNPGPLNALLKSLGLNLLGLEVAPCSFVRFLEALDPSTRGKTYCQLHFEGGQARLIVVEQGMPVFVRDIFLDAANPDADRRKIDLSGGIAFAQKQFQVAALNFVRLSGQGADLESWRTAFAQELPVAPLVQDFKAPLKLKDADWAACAAIGASLKFSLPQDIALDLGSENKVTAEEIKTAKLILAVFAAGALWFAGLGLLSALGGWRAQGRVARAHKDPSLDAVFANKTPAEIDAMMSSLQDQLETVRTAGFDAPRTTELIKDISDGIPERVWLASLSLESPLPAGESPAKLELSGHAEGSTPRDEEDMVFNYKNKLAKSPALGKTFPNIQVSVSHKAVEAQAGTALTPGEGAAPQEERTSFVLTGQ